MANRANFCAFWAVGLDYQTVQKVRPDRVGREPGSGRFELSARAKADPEPGYEPKKAASQPDRPNGSSDHRPQPFVTEAGSRPSVVYETEWLVQWASVG